MSITYPLSLPTTGINQITLRAVNQTAMTASPFTYKQQIHNHAGQQWEAEVKIPPLDRAEAEVWLGFLLSLNGRAGTFIMGDPAGATARGEAGGTPLVNGGAQTGSSLTIDGATTTQSGWLKAGDYIQLGSSGSATLHKVMQDVATVSGQATLDIWPSIRTAPANNETVVVSNAVGRWRLNSGQQDWSINSATIYGITFAAVEAIT